jgi:hypothetical protein
VAALAQSFNMDITTDFGQIEQVIQGKIDKNRAKVVSGGRFIPGRDRIHQGRRENGKSHG